MLRHNRICGLILFTLVYVTATSVFAAFPFMATDKKVEADPSREYYLTESDGHWFIMAKTFVGDDARKKANELTLELRKKYKLNAFIFKLDTDQNDLDVLGRQNATIKKYRYQTQRGVEYAVLVGSFPSCEDLNLQNNLLTIKRCKPDCLAKDPFSVALVQKYAELTKKDREYAGYGPLGGALAVPNPLRPIETYSQKGVVDQFIEKINSDSPYNLLNNPKMYTLRVATFSGDSTFQKFNEGEKSLKNKLEMAGITANILCKALRKRGIDAWEFHDRDSSFVTIGSFDSYGDIRADGRTEINPEINKLIEKYRGQLTQNVSGAYRAYTVNVETNELSGGGLSKKKKLEIPFDLQPVIIMVPQRPENTNKALLAKRKLDSEIHKNEIQRVEESLLEESQEHDHRYAEALKPKAVPDGVSIEAFLSQQASGQGKMAGNTPPAAPIQTNHPQQTGAQPYAQVPYSGQQTATVGYQNTGYSPNVPVSGMAMPQGQGYVPAGAVPGQVAQTNMPIAQPVPGNQPSPMLPSGNQTQSTVGYQAAAPMPQAQPYSQNMTAQGYYPQNGQSSAALQPGVRSPVHTQASNNVNVQGYANQQNYQQNPGVNTNGYPGQGTQPMIPIQSAPNVAPIQTANQNTMVPPTY